MDVVNKFKSIKAISAIAQRSFQVSRLYFTTSHGKSKSDGLGGVIKSFVSRAVASEGVIIRTASELYQFCQEHLTNISKEKSIVRNRFFILVDPNDVKIFKDKIDACQYKSIKGTLKLHQVSNKVSLKSGIFIRNFICTCIPCRDHEFQLCQSKIYPAPEIFSSIAYMSKETNFKEISFHWYSFKFNSKIQMKVMLAKTKKML